VGGGLTRLPRPSLARKRQRLGVGEFELRAAGDVREALACAETAAGGERIFTLYALLDQGGRRGLVRLAGIDPTAASGED
jgi:hypothetical protein